MYTDINGYKHSGTTRSFGDIVTYTHPLDLSRNKISAQIEPDTILTFTADVSDKNNFTVQYTTDEHNDNVVQLGLDNVSYALSNNAIAITFERVSSSPTVYIRENTTDPYMNVTLYSGIVTDSANALTIINTPNLNHSGERAMYTHDKTARTVTLWIMVVHLLVGQLSSRQSTCIPS